jgi:hypothetical protein
MKAGSKDTSILRKKKKVPEVLRRLLGEYRDPMLNFARSASKMHWFLANHYFLTEMYNNGKGLFLFTGHERGRPADFNTQIAAKGSKTMNPLDGLRTRKDLVQGMSDIIDSNEYHGFFREYIRMNAWLKYGKTILSPTTQMRNFWSASLFTVMNGHMATPARLKKAFQVARSDLFTKDGVWQDYIKDLTDRGVLHDNPHAGELRDALKDAMETDIYVPGLRGKLRRGAKVMQSLYQVGDDFWKMVGYQSEVERQVSHGMELEAAKDRAAYLIRNGYPTYSMVPRAIKGLRRFPLVGTFVSFPAEILRTSYNQFKFIGQELKAGNTDLAIKRMVGMATASSVTGAASMLSAALLGLDGDDDEKLRMMVPEWSRNSQLLHAGYDEDGLPSYVDISFMDPYAYLKKPLIALFNGNNVTAYDAVLDALRELGEPFYGPDIASGAFGELIFNQKMSGGQVYNPEDPPDQKGWDIINHLRKAGQPGVFSNVERMALAMQGETTRTGKAFDTADEALALLGVRISTINIPQSIRYHGYGFTDSKRNATRILSYTAGDQSTVTDSELEDAFGRMTFARQRAYRQMIRRAEAAKSLGVSETKIRAALKAAGVSRADISAVINGEIVPWKRSRQFIRSATEGALVATPNLQKKQTISREVARRIQVIDRLAKEAQQ